MAGAPGWEAPPNIHTVANLCDGLQEPRVGETLRTQKSLRGASRSKAQLCLLLSQRELWEQESSPMGEISPGFTPSSRDGKVILKRWKTKTVQPRGKEPGALQRWRCCCFRAHNTACGAARSDGPASSPARDEPTSPAEEACSLNHGAPREAPAEAF